MAAAETESRFLPLACAEPGVTYPLQVLYCGGRSLQGFCSEDRPGLEPE